MSALDASAFLFRVGQRCDGAQAIRQRAGRHRLAVQRQVEQHDGPGLLGAGHFAGARQRPHAIVDHSRNYGFRMIVGLGSDLCNIERIQASLDRFGERFEQRVFTEVERTKAARRPFLPYSFR